MSLFAASLLMLAGETGQRTIDNWMVYDGADIERESILFVERSGLYQRPDGWINFSFQEVRNGSRLKTVKTVVLGTWVNCKTRQYINDYRMEYGRDGAMLQEGKLDEQRRVPAPGSAEARVLAFACGDTGGATQLPRGANFIAYADSLYGQGHPQVARAPAVPTVGAPTAATGPAVDYWMVYDGAGSGYESMQFIDRSSVVHGADGTTHFNTINILYGSQQKNADAKLGQFAMMANCQTRELATERSQFFGGSKDSDVIVSKGPPKVAAPGTIGERFLTFVCGDTAGAIQLESGVPLVTYADMHHARYWRQGGNAPAPRAPGTPPDYWQIASTNDASLVTFIDKASIVEQPDGKATFAIGLVNNAEGQVALAKKHALIDCVQHTYRDLDVTAYDRDEHLLGSGAPLPEAPIEARSPLAKVLAFVCEGNDEPLGGHAIQVPARYSLIKFAADFRRLLYQVASHRTGSPAPSKKKRQ